jgi:hypothetical protein
MSPSFQRPLELNSQQPAKTGRRRVTQHVRNLQDPRRRRTPTNDPSAPFSGVPAPAVDARRRRRLPQIDPIAGGLRLSQ